MTETITLSDEQRALLRAVATAMGLSGEELTAPRYAVRSPAHARGYLQAFVDKAGDVDVLLAYFLLSMLVSRES